MIPCLNKRLECKLDTCTAGDGDGWKAPAGTCLILTEGESGTITLLSAACMGSAAYPCLVCLLDTILLIIVMSFMIHECARAQLALHAGQHEGARVQHTGAAG